MDLRTKIRNAIRANLLEAGIRSYDIEQMLDSFVDDLIKIIERDKNEEKR